ncbi:MAG: hypothetical protein NVS4B3_14950 [Gemmatimonadaceae bacterium]
MRDMPFLVVGGERFALPIGESTLGGSEVPIPELTGSAALAVVTVTPEHLATIHAVRPNAAVSLDGEPVGVMARPMRHGARIDVAGVRLLYGDIRAIGSTSHVAGITDDEMAALAGLSSVEPTADRGGRLVALGSGTVHPIPDSGLSIGRDPACGVVLAGKEVSRRHATIAPGLFGYVLTDGSANGVFVNGRKIDGTQVLGQHDVVRIATAEFRFEAEVASFEPSPELRTSPSSQANANASRSPSIATTLPGEKPGLLAIPAQLPTLLATLEVLNEGPGKGTRIRLERPIVHLGRGPQNDVVLRDESVSGSHATLRQTDGAWLVTDGGSTNGTYVDGDRIRGEHRLSGPAELRFGNVKLLFRPMAARRTTAKGTRDIVGVGEADK